MEDAPGWYGKLSSLGDFVHRRTSSSLRTLLDDWLSRAITDSRERLGSRWLNAYLTAPLWRFAWTPGIADERWWFGVLMPSCDNVGRYFPLVVLEPHDALPMDAVALHQLERWYDHLAHAALRTLHEHASPDELDNVLYDAPAWPVQGSEDGNGALAACLRAVLVQEFLADAAGRSIWWSGASAIDALQLLTGLPRGDDFVALLHAGGAAGRNS